MTPRDWLVAAGECVALLAAMVLAYLAMWGLAAVLR